MGYMEIYPQTKTVRYRLYRALQRHLYLVSKGLPDSFWMDKGIPPTPKPETSFETPHRGARLLKRIEPSGVRVCYTDNRERNES
jgi:hypothetical protein